VNDFMSALRLPLIAAALLMAACAHVPADSPDAARPLPVGEPAQLDARGQLQFHILTGEMAAGRRMAPEAAHHFLAAAKLSGEPEFAARATAYAVAADDTNLALEAGELWMAAEPDNPSVREILARLYLRAGRLAETLTHVNALVRQHPGGQADGYRAAAMLLTHEPERLDGALAVMKQVVAQDESVPEAHYAMALFAVRVGELGLAEQAAREALRLQPEYREAGLMLAGIQVKQGELDEAENTMEGLIAGAEHAADLRVGFARLLLEAHHTERAREQLRLALEFDPDHADALFALGLLALEDQDLDEGERQLQRLYRSGQRRADAAYYLGRIEELRGNDSAALRWYEQVVLGPQAVDATIRRAAVTARNGRIADARALLERLRRHHPQLSLRLYGAEGEILYTHDRFHDAVEVYDLALEQYPDEPDLLYARALAYERMDRFDLAEQDLRYMIELDENDARSLNALGYLLTLHTERYDEALRLIERALALEPDDAAIIDSMGWVQFHLGNLAEARRWLQRAFDKMPDPEIAAHLGEVLWHMGERERARQIWDGALEETPDHRTLRETVDRLTR
jgi:tetratricopeptide (TPR) repeat protein